MKVLISVRQARRIVATEAGHIRHYPFGEGVISIVRFWMADLGNVTDRTD
jgi:hypothetical protein